MWLFVDGILFFWLLVGFLCCCCATVAQNNNQPICRDSAALSQTPQASLQWWNKSKQKNLSAVPFWESCLLSFVFQFLKCQYWVWLHWLVLWLSDSCLMWSRMWLSITVFRCTGKSLLFKAFRERLWHPVFLFFFPVFCHSFSYLLKSPTPCLGGPCWKSPFSGMCCSWKPVANHHLAKRWQSHWGNKCSGRFHSSIVLYLFIPTQS